jgi:ribosomal protein S13
MGSRKDLFEKSFFRIKQIYDTNLAQGIVMAGNSTKLNKCFRRFTRSNAKVISDSIKNNVLTVEVRLRRNRDQMIVKQYSIASYGFRFFNEMQKKNKKTLSK